MIRAETAGAAGQAMEDPTVASTADVDHRAILGSGTTVWHLAQIREHARLGRDCIVGRGAFVGPGVVIGNNVKLQNYALVYEPARLEDGVFIGPAVILTNDTYPRSVDVSGKLKRHSDWTPAGVVVREGASLGARVVVVAGRVIGRWSLVAAGAVVTRDVPDFAIFAGVPPGESAGSAEPGSRWLRTPRGGGDARAPANPTRNGMMDWFPWPAESIPRRRCKRLQLAVLRAAPS